MFVSGCEPRREWQHVLCSVCPKAAAMSARSFFFRSDLVVTATRKALGLSPFVPDRVRLCKKLMWRWLKLKLKLMSERWGATSDLEGLSRPALLDSVPDGWCSPWIDLLWFEYTSNTRFGSRWLIWLLLSWICASRFGSRRWLMADVVLLYFKYTSNARGGSHRLM